MRQVLSKTFEVAGRASRQFQDGTRAVTAFLRSVDIDQQRGVLLCIGLQLILVLAFLLAFSPISTVRALPGQSAEAPASNLPAN